MIINCKEIANNILEKVKVDIDNIKQKNINPKLVIIKANNDLASEKYINNKIKKANELGIDVELIVDDSKNTKNILNIIDMLNIDDLVHGIIVQLPLYKELDKEKIIERVNYKKDVDGFSLESVAKLWNDSNDFFSIPCTAYGIIEIIKSLKYDIVGKNVVIINKSNIVGKPLASLFLKNQATVTICHSKTKNLQNHTKNADIIIVAVGKKDFLTKEMVSNNSFIIDVGINVVENKIYGDAKFDELKDYVKYITPVPNGVGQLTIAMIYKNLIELIKRRLF